VGSAWRTSAGFRASRRMGFLHGGDFGLRWPTAGWVKDVAAIAGADAGSHREPGLRCLSHCSTLPRPVSAEIEDQE
jgi:hypothetical protein